MARAERTTVKGQWINPIAELMLELLPRHLLSILFFLLICALLSGWVGAGLGVDELFRDDRAWWDTHKDAKFFGINSPALSTSMALMISALTIAWFALNQELDPGQDGIFAHLADDNSVIPRERRALVFGAAVAAIGLVLYGVAASAWLGAPDPEGAGVPGERLRVALGAFLGVLIFGGIIIIGALLRWIVDHALKQARSLAARLDLSGQTEPNTADDAADSEKTASTAVAAAQRPLGVLSRALTNGGREAKRIFGWGRGRIADYADRAPALRFIFFSLPAVAAFTLVFLFGRVIPAVALFTLLLGLYVALEVTRFFPNWLKTLVVIVLLTLLFLQDREPFRLAFENIEGPGGRNAYSAPVSLQCLRADHVSDGACADALAACPVGEAAARAATDATRKRDCGTAEAAQLVEPLASLHAWKANLLAASRGGTVGDPLGGPFRPKLVLVATSGGAYRAAFWTALILDRLVEEDRAGRFPGLGRAIRLFTGASGGMVGAAYFAATATKAGPAGDVLARMEADIVQAQREGCDDAAPPLYRTIQPIPRDTLSSVAQHMLQVDVPSLFTATAVPLDRGEVLEQQWCALSTTFAALRAGEAEGWRPSLIFTPTIAETGRPMAISNLDLRRLAEGSERGGTPAFSDLDSFFEVFPCAQGAFRLATAVRMNASFPLVSPAVRLPTCEPRSVVDAGYFDNYGVSTAAAFLADPEVRAWVAENTSGVILIQLRAFPLGLPDEVSCQRPDPAAKDAKSDTSAPWITKPLEAVLGARAAAMAIRGRQDLAFARALYGPGTPIDTVVLVNSADVSLNWYLPGHELDAMRRCFETLWHDHAGPTLRVLWQKADGG